MDKMEEKTKYFVIAGAVGLLLTTLVQSLVLSRCSELGCLFLVAIFALPGLLLQDVGTLSLAAIRTTNVIFYFIVGGIIGLIIHKIRNK
jgi:surface polysaccharide O-acyltransferase-like enzyme